MKEKDKVIIKQKFSVFGSKYDYETGVILSTSYNLDGSVYKFQVALKNNIEWFSPEELAFLK